MTRSTSTFKRVLTGSMLAVLVLFVASCGTSDEATEGTTTVAAAATTLPGEFSGYVRSPAVDVSNVTLPSVGGDPVTMKAEPGGLLIVFFGYATCPDICPMTLSILKSAVGNQAPADQDRVRVAMITIDPTRDAPDEFASYLARYFDDAWALRTDEPNELRAAADAFGAEFRIRMNQEGRREVSHSDDLYVIDETGTVVLTWSYGLTPEAITADLTRLLAGDRPATAD